MPEPDRGEGTISTEDAGPEAGSPAVPEPEAGPATPPGADAPVVQVPAPAPAPKPAVPAATQAEPSPAPAAAIDPTLLDAAEPEATAPVATRPPAAGSSSTGLSPEERSAALDSAYAARYRPPDNPVRLNIAGRVMFANASGKQGVNGRIGGAAVDIGPAWNRLAVAATFTGWGGSIQLQEGSGTELNAMLGGGPSLGLGRLALMTHGYVDLRLGYDVYYGAVGQRGDASVAGAPDDDPQVVATLTENLLPHGPRARLDMGLIGSSGRRFFHGFGLSMGYQALVGSLRGELPVTHMLTIGFSYWMG